MAGEILDTVYFVVKEALFHSGWLSEFSMEKDYANLCITLKRTNWMKLEIKEEKGEDCLENITNKSTPALQNSEMTKVFITKVDDREPVNGYSDISRNRDFYSEQKYNRIDAILDPLTQELTDDTNDETSVINLPSLDKIDADEQYETSIDPQSCSEQGEGSLSLPRNVGIDTYTSKSWRKKRHNIGRPKKKLSKKEMNLKLTLQKLKQKKKRVDEIFLAETAVKKADNDKRFPCTQCNYKAPSRGKLERHETTHSKEKPYVCSLCEFRTKREDALTKHRLIHTGEKPYQCELCDYTARTHQGLSKHVASHGEKTFACQHCEYKAALKGTLKKHEEQVHKTIDLFRCDLCSFQTISKDRHRSHIIAHEKKTAFTCTICDKTFMIKREYNTHMKVHMPRLKEKDHPCPHCDKRFPLLHSMIRHMAEDHGIKGHECRLCGLIYTRKQHLTKHHLKKHPNEAIYHCQLCDYYSNEGREYRQHLTSVDHLGKEMN